MTSLTQINAPFNGAELLIVDFNHQPYVPMKPIVEGMGLAWQTQHRKLIQGYNQNGDTPNRWGVSIIETPTLSGIQEMLCIPLRKIFAWLMTISPNKVKPELRDTVIMYQNECDDVLWDYWTKGQAINERHTISAEQAGILHDIVTQRSGENGKIRAQMWARLKSHFKYTASYRELKAIHFDDAVHYLETMHIRGESSKVISEANLATLQIMVEDISQGDSRIEQEIYQRLNSFFEISHQSQLPAIHYVDAAKYLKKMEQVNSQRVPLLPIPFQRGRYLVVVNAESTTIHNVNDYDFIEKGVMQKFYENQKQMYSDLYTLISQPFLDTLAIKHEHELPAITKMVRML